MAQFYGTVTGARGEASRTGTKESGITVTAASMTGAIETRLWTDHTGTVQAHVETRPWYYGAGHHVPRVTLYRGPLNKDAAAALQEANDD